TRQRIELLLSRALTAQVSSDKIRMVRAIEVLEQIGSAEATELLRELAKGFPSHRQTREAKETLERIKQRISNDRIAEKTISALPIGGPLPTGAKVRLGGTLFRHQDFVSGPRLGGSAVAVSADGAMIASARHGVIHLWETQTGKLLGKKDY